MKTQAIAVLGVVFGAALFLTGCPPQGIVCAPGTGQCGQGCADFSSDRRNCGGCGLSCQPGQACANSACVCAEGAVQCGGRCVFTATDPQHCGACNNQCPGTEVCEVSSAPDGGAQSACVAFCSPASTLCGSSCVNLASANTHCGACGNACGDGRVCRQGTCTYDAVIACRNFGQVRGLRNSPSGIFSGPLTSLGTTPNALAAYSDVLLVSDDTDRVLIQASLRTFGELRDADGGSLRVALGNVPNQVYVAPGLPFAFVPNALGNTLQIIQLEADAGLSDGGAPHPFGLDASTIAEVNFGANTGPQGVVVQGQYAYVPLYGGFGASASAGQKLAIVNISNPALPTLESPLDLTTLNLQSFDGGAAIPRPFAVTSFGGKIYAVLNNLDADYAPAGPGLLAEFDPSLGSLTTVDLDANRCLNPVSFAKQGSDTLLISCNGKATYDANFVLQAVEKAGVVLLGANAPGGPLVVKSSWAPTCPSSTSCKPASIGRIAAVGNRVFVADQGEGRIWVLENNAGTLTEQTALFLEQACPATDATHPYSNVADILALP